MTVTPTLSPWPAPTLADAAPPSQHPAPPPSSDVDPAQRKPVAALLDAARRLTSRSERAAHAAMKEEQRIRQDLVDLPAGWFVLHPREAEEIDEIDKEVDHLVIGPSGVFLVYLEHQPGSKVWISEHQLTIDGRDSDRLRRSRSEARRTSGLLTEATGQNVTAQAVVVLIGAATMQTLSRPAEVHVRDQHDLRDWLCRQPLRLDAEVATAIHARLRPSDVAPEGALIGLVE